VRIVPKKWPSPPAKPNINQVASVAKCELPPVIDLFHPDFGLHPKTKNN
jgi:hypothetical protein